MTVTAMVRCDGTPEVRPTIPLGQCRAAYPARVGEPEDAVLEAEEHGWHIADGLHLCPSCARYRR